MKEVKTLSLAAVVGRRTLKTHETICFMILKFILKAMLLLVFDVLQLHADVTQGVRSESSRQRQIINERIETHMR